MKFNSFFKTFLLGFLIVFVTSCDKDFNEIGADFVDNDHYNFTSEKFDVVAYNQHLGPVQTNNLPINALGFYNNPVFGTTTASFVTQLELATVNPTFYKLPADIVIDSVYLHVPYFSTLQSTDATTGDSTYQLDSIYGAGKIKLEVFRSNYYLRNLDANPISGLLEQQNYFSNQQGDIELVTPPNQIDRLNDPAAPSTQNIDFEFSPAQIKFFKTNASGVLLSPLEVRERLLPGIYMDLKKDVFKTAIIQAGAANLADNNVFKNYFRGIYFKASSHADNPTGAALSMLNFAQGKIVIVYKDNKSATDLAQIRKTITLNMRGFTVNLLENASNGTISNNLYNAQADNSADTPSGDSRLYVKGGAGSLSVINLFRGLRNDDAVDPNDPSYENPLHKMRRENWLVNEANLVFNIDNTPSGMGANDISLEPNRIYLYDLTNNRPLIDFFLDGLTNPNPKFNKPVHGGIIQKVSSTSRGTKYKIRITNHIRNLIRYGGSDVVKDSTNVKLGLVVTESINSVANAKVLNPFSYIQTNIVTGLPEVKMGKNVPAMSVVNPLGTVLFGSSTAVPLSERLQLEIIYTKPD